MLLLRLHLHSCLISAFTRLDSLLRHDIQSIPSLIRLLLRVCVIVPAVLTLWVLAAVMFVVHDVIIVTLLQRLNSTPASASKSSASSHSIVSYRPSRTSIIVAFARAQAYVCSGGCDELAIHMLNPTGIVLLASWRVFSYGVGSYRLSSTVSARNNYGDRALLRSLTMPTGSNSASVSATTTTTSSSASSSSSATSASSPAAASSQRITQVVLLGAGLDTRFHRLRQLVTQHQHLLQMLPPVTDSPDVKTNTTATASSSSSSSSAAAAAAATAPPSSSTAASSSSSAPLSLPSDLLLIEVDAPTTQGYKRRQLDLLHSHTSRSSSSASSSSSSSCSSSNVSLTLPPVHFVPVDFNSQDWLQQIEQNVPAFSRTKPTLFLWEGVVYYLPSSAIHHTLANIALCAPGSLLVFDWFRVDPQQRLLRRLNRFLRLVGEPWLSVFQQPSEVADLLAQHRLTLIDNVNSMVYVKQCPVELPTASFVPPRVDGAGVVSSFFRRARHSARANAGVYGMHLATAKLN